MHAVSLVQIGDIYFVQDGQVTVMLEQEEGPPVRLETMGGGVLGEIGFYLGYERTASVVVDVPSRIYRLSGESLQGLLEEFASRDGTDYGERETPLEERVAQLRRRLDDGELKLLFDLASETWDLLPKDEAGPRAGLQSLLCKL